MVAIKLLVLSVVSLCAYGLPSTSLTDRDLPITKNTIFSDERLPGEIFENVDAFNDIELTRNGEISPYRLPTTTRPKHYKIHWIIDMLRAHPTQSGKVEIQLYATQTNVSEIVIHCDELDVFNVVLTQGNIVIPTTPVEDKPYQFLRVRLLNGVLAFNSSDTVYYTLTIEFGANLRTNMYGIYLNWFTNPPNPEIRYMASTQFQATAARWAFPCYDEPSFKATFDVTITRPTGYGSWFCTGLKNSVETVGTPNFYDDEYHTTPEMSTYLLALIVADYGSITATNATGTVKYEVIARRGAITDQGLYAFNTGQYLLGNMSAHTDYDFYDQHDELKMTQAAIPDFGAGAMENWGLLTYREAYLMYDPNETNSNFKQLIAYILSHEIAHMWFGNLVTCDWWDVLWLNEGFARYYQYFLTSWVEDYMEFETRFIPEQVHTALLTDSANNPQPLTNPGVATNAAVSAMFGTISYNKGAAVIRMTEHLLGTEVHTKGLRSYLRERQFKTALPIHLFENLELAGIEEGALNYGPDFSFIEYYKSWTEQPGHPVLDVQVNHQTGIMTVYQRRFNINYGYSPITNNYIIPITFATASNPDFSNTKPTDIIRKGATIINRGSIGDEWVVFNKQQTGFYRVNYDEYTWDLIVMALRQNVSVIHEYNRAQIVNDVFQFARSGLMPYSRALNILSFLENDTAYAPWVAAITGFNWLRGRLSSNTTVEQLEKLESRIEDWARNVMAKLTYYPPESEDEDFLDSYLRWQLAPLMCNLGNEECRQAAIDQFEFQRNGTRPVPPDSRNWVYCNALRQGDYVEFEYLWDRFLNHNVYTEKILILQNIGCTKNATSLYRVMDAIIYDNYVIRPQDYNTAFSSVVNGNEENTLIALEYIKEFLPNVTAAFNGSPATPLSYVTARLRNEDDINDFLEWAADNRQELGNAYNSAVNGATSTREGYRWAATIEADLVSFLEEGPVVVTTSTTASPTPPPPVVTTSQPSIAQPSTPDLPTTPASAASSFLAIAAMVFAIMANIIL